MVYLVQGSAGEYDGYHEWIVRAFLKKESADKFVTELNVQLSKCKNGRKREGDKSGLKLDPEFDQRNDYCVIEIELESE